MQEQKKLSILAMPAEDQMDQHVDDTLDYNQEKTQENAIRPIEKKLNFKFLALLTVHLLIFSKYTNSKTSTKIQSASSLTNSPSVLCNEIGVNHCICQEIYKNKNCPP